jgi:hypothetical protein
MAFEGYDPYKDALVVEEETIWPEGVANFDESVRQAIERLAHARPETAEKLAYIKLPTGFCRRITLTPAQVDRFVDLLKNHREEL